MDENDIQAQVGRIMRLATELVAGVPHATHDEIVALVAYAYARGNRDGYAEGAQAAENAFAAVNAKLREDERR